MKQSRFGALFFVALFFLAPIADAASLYIDPAFRTIGRGDSITMSVRLDTNEAEEECINAVDGVITYPDTLIPVDVSIGDSIFSMWVEQPKIDKEARRITFAGGIPNGYCGRIAGDPRLTNTIVKLIFRSPGFLVGSSAGTSTAKVDFTPETTAYLNDGFGTKADLALYGSTIDLADDPSPVLVDDWREAVNADDISPEEFSIDLQKSQTTFGGKYFIVFNTTDKQTGIDHYEVMEEPVSRLMAFEWGRADAPWITAPSPYPLEDQSLNSIIRVKAVDKAGNEYVATLIPEEEMRGISTNDIIVGAGLLLVVLLVLAIFWVALRAFLKRRKNIQLTEKTDNHQ